MKNKGKTILLRMLFTKFQGVTSPCCRFYHAKHLRVSKLYPGLQGTVLSEGTQNVEAESFCHSQKLMLHNRLIYGGAAGTYTMLPLMTRSLEKLQRVIDQEMQNIGAQKITMPCLASGKMWKKSKRWEVMGSELLKLTDRNNKDLCLAPTHEEAVTSLLSENRNLSNLKLPVKLYQIGRKFRDEMRPKHGLLRCREFEMKDLYTFDVGIEEAGETYEEVCEAYQVIFKRLGLDVLKVEADTGAMGGSKSHEFHLQSDIGEDNLLRCPQCDKCVNEELGNDVEDSQQCSHSDCAKKFQSISGIEVAHAFILGTKYSQIFNAKVHSHEKASFVYYSMGCFGIGVTRLLAAGIEVLSTEEDLRWPTLLAPHQICIIPQQTGYHFEESVELATRLQSALLCLPNLHNEVIVDDRHKLSIGRRLKLGRHAGTPYLIAVGKKSQQDPPLYEIKDTTKGTTEYLTADQIVEKMSKLQTVLV